MKSHFIVSDCHNYSASTPDDVHWVRETLHHKYETVCVPSSVHGCVVILSLSTNLSNGRYNMLKCLLLVIRALPPAPSVCFSQDLVQGKSG